MPARWIALALLVFLLLPSSVRAAGRADGPGEERPPPGGARVLLVERPQALAAGADELLRVRFPDGAQLTLGPDSQAEVRHYAYDPRTRHGRLELHVAAGAFEFASGAMRKEGYDIRTPFATLALHGTRLGVDLVNEGILVIEGAIEARFMGGEVLRLKASECTGGRRTPRSVASGRACEGEIAGHARLMALEAEILARQRLRDLLMARVTTREPRRPPLRPPVRLRPTPRPRPISSS